jgi:hypothetical protein
MFADEVEVRSHQEVLMSSLSPRVSVKSFLKLIPFSLAQVLGSFRMTLHQSCCTDPMLQ